MKDIALFNYWEHFKFLKDLALIYPPDHPRIVELTKIVNEIQLKLKP